MQILNTNPSDRTLKQFAWCGAFILALVAAPWTLYRGHPTTAVVCWLAAVVLCSLAVVNPRLARWPFIAASVVTWPIGLAVSYAALAVVYYLVFTPLALVFRLIGRDALDRKFDPEADSYWEACPPEQDSDRYLRQF